MSLEFHNLMVGIFFYFALVVSYVVIPLLSIAGAIYLILHRFQLRLLTTILMVISAGGIVGLNFSHVRLTLDNTYDVGWPLGFYSTEDKFGSPSFGLMSGSTAKKGQFSKGALLFDIAHSTATLICVAFISELLFRRLETRKLASHSRF